jgi:predicted nucleotidyltransferase/DNA-binding XRE family transcriptional regulator
MKRLTDIGAVLVEARRMRAMTQSELGRQLGVSQPQIARWEAAAYRNISLERVSAVADAVGISIQLPDLPNAAETSAVYAAIPPGVDADVMHALARTGVGLPVIAAFARSHKVERLELFGSVLRADFRPESDIDVLVTYEQGASPSLFSLADHEAELGAIFRRVVDLVSRPGIERSENSLRRSEILSQAKTLYARS